MTLQPPASEPAWPAAPSRERYSWYMYDWANSAFSTTVVTVFFGPYLTSLATAAADASGAVYPLGLPVQSGALFPYVVSVSVLIQVLLFPLLGTIADYTQRKKQLLACFAYLGAAATMGMYTLEGRAYFLGGMLFIVANVSFGASLLLYNAFLPELASADERDAVSSTGWALGYLGGGILLALNLLLLAQASAIGLSTGQAVRLNLASAGVWWAIFTLIPLWYLRNRQPTQRPPAGRSVLSMSLQQLRHTLRQARQYPQTLLFLGAYLLYNDGIQTVIALSSQFGQEELGLSLATLTSVILMVQFMAFVGARLFNTIARRLGTKRAILVTLVLWTGVLVYAYGWLHTAAQFFGMGAVIALVLGGSQALSRSLFSQLIPQGQEAEYFSLYEIGERGTSWLGPLCFGLALQYSGSYRLALLSLIGFFVAGLTLLALLNVPRAIAAVGNQVPTRP
ncbi:MAG: MFS transporter [Candidatus Tectimicrobiota bacterium]